MKCSEIGDLAVVRPVWRMLLMPKPKYDGGTSAIPLGSEKAPNCQVLSRGTGAAKARRASALAATISP